MRMGKIIVKNIKGMSWKARIGLIAIFTLVFSTIIYQGWNQNRNAHAAVAVTTNWAILGTGTTGTLPAMSLAKGTGSNRLLVVKVTAEYTASYTTFTPTVTYGGQTLTKIISTDLSGRRKVSFHYLNEAGIVAATNTNFTVAWNTTPQAGCRLSAAFYANVNQTTPISGARSDGASTALTSPLSGTINVTNGGTAIYGSIVDAATPSTPATGYTEVYDTANGTLHQTALGIKAITATGTENPLPTWAAQRYGFAAIGLNPAITTLGNGVAGTNATVAPGAVDQKINGFSLVTNAANTTDSITSLTVTTTNQAAIASMRITNEAGTTQYFGTLANPGSNTWTFSGGTPIPVTNTAANYKVLVTYKTRVAGAPAGLTTTTANVTAVTTNNFFAGTDTADTTLTLSNVHAPSTWGTCTPGEAQNVLNWTYGTPGQTALIIRYTANSDTTKPVDGTNYGIGIAFGSGGTVVYNGTASTYTNNGLTNGTTYYYKIFEYDANRNYYNASDVWTPALTPVSSDPTPPVVDAGFSATSPVNSVNIPITSYSATDAFPGVSGYMITTTTAQPAAGAAGWTVTPPAAFTVAGQGSYALYPWAKDGSGNVSPLYASPVTVIVDLTKPTVSAFTVTTPVASRNIPVVFTAADTGGSNLAGYMITTNSTPPAVDDLGWLVAAPATFTVATDGSFTLYPWVKDAAGNVSLAFATPRNVTVDTTPPAGLSLLTPLDEAVNLPPATTLSCNPATDSAGGIMYQFNVTGDDNYSANSGWQSGTTYAPPALVKGNQYLWSVKAKDALGNETPSTALRTFSIIAPCVRNNPNLILLTPGGNKAEKITTDSGVATYNLRLLNNDTGDCGSTTFSLSTYDVDLGEYFEDSVFDNGLTTKTVTLATNSEITTPVTIRSMPGEDSGDGKTMVRSLDPNHTPESGPAYFESGWVLTNLNVVTCVPKAPLMIVGPDSGYLNKGGQMVYTITVRNNDVGAGCTPVPFNLSIPTETNSTDFNPSQLNPVTLLLNSGELRSTTLTVSAKATAAKNAVNSTSVAIAATGHESPANVTVISTVNNPMLHNSDNISSTRWGGWGVPGKRYGEISCETCHVGGGGDTANIKRVEERIFTPYTTGTAVRLPGHNKPVSYRRYDGTVSSQPVLGWDAGATPRAASTRVCEVCHTYDAAAVNGVKAHPYATAAALDNHYSTDGTDCTRCHKHNKGFGTANMSCNACHGNNSVETVTADNRYDIAPPTSASGTTGTLTGVGQVSNNPKVGAHQTHLQLFNGFNSYSTVDYRCQSCHGALPVGLAHASDNSLPAFQGMAVRGGVSASFNSTSLTCSTYCHNPAASTVLKNAGNTGSKVFPSWTSARLLGDTRKTQANCGVCHKSPGDAGFEPAASHTGMTIDNTSCTVCHGHDGDGQGIAGRRHMDGYFFGGTCNGCHGYENGTWAAAAERIPAISQGKGSHEKHIAYLVAQWGGTLNPNSDGFGSGAAWTNVCGVCHAGAVHTVGEAFGGTGRTIAFPAARQFGPLAPVYNGNPATGSATNLKTCSNLDCHYKVTPVWSTY